MVSFTEKVTIYTPVYNEEMGFDDYWRTEIEGVSWQAQNRTVASGNGLQYARLFRVRVPAWAKCDKRYKAFEEMNNPEKQYTLKPGCIVMLGSGPEAPTNGAALAALAAGRGDTFRVLAIHDNRRRCLPHLLIEGA